MRKEDILLMVEADVLNNCDVVVWEALGKGKFNCGRARTSCVGNGHDVRGTRMSP